MGTEFHLNERIASIPPSATLRITSRAKAMAAEGRTVYSFAAGEPDFDTPERIKAAAAKALADGKTKYSPASGLAELREAIAAKLERENGLSYDPARIIVNDGAKHSLFNVIMTVCREGDEVIIPAPYWLSYPEMVKMAGGKPVFVHASQEQGFRIGVEQLEAAVTDRTVALVLNSPGNPTGAVYERGELEALVRAAAARGLWIIADEIYEKLVYDGAEHVSAGRVSDEVFARTVTVNGFSKAFSMTGWRLGYCAGPEPLMKAVGALQSHSTSGPNTFAQWGAVEALQGEGDEVGTMLAAFAERRALLYERLTALPGVSCVKPMGAFYMLPDIGALGMDSLTFAERLLDEEGVAVVPGAPFGADDCVRLSYACSTENIERGLDAMAKFVARLG